MAESKNDDSKNPIYTMDVIPKFTGDDITYSSTKWTQDLDDNADIFGWSQQQKLIIARRCLAGTAELWLKTEKTFRSYEELKAALMKEFPEMVNSKQMHETMSRRKKQPNESFYQYMLVMKELGKRAKFPDYVAIQYIIDGIADYESNKLLFYGVTSYSVLKEKLVLYESFKEKSKKSVDTMRRGQRDAVIPRIKTEPVPTLGHRCYNCGEIGHLSSSCRKGIKCFKCNGFGHKGTECRASHGMEAKKASNNYYGGGDKQDRRSMFVQQQEDAEDDEMNENELYERERCDLNEQDAVAEKPTEESIVPVQNDVHSSPDHDLFIEDAEDGSGLDADESSGSGWGAGPGPDDEDGRAGSGDLPLGPPDDEDYATTTTTQKPEATERTVTETNTPQPEEPDYIDLPELTESPDVPSVDPILPIDPRQFDVLIPNLGSRPGSGTSEEGAGAGDNQPSRPDQTDISISGEDLAPSVEQEPSGSNVNQESRAPDKVVIMNKPEDRATSFFAQPGILAAVIGGAVVGLLCAILVVMFIVYRMRKKDEGSYALDEPKRSPAAASYGKGHNNREFYA